MATDTTALNEEEMTFVAHCTFLFLLAGRLRLSKLKTGTDGWDGASQGYDYATTFGGRGFSILDADTMTRVYDSGDWFERHIAEGALDTERAMFNTQVGSDSQPQSQLFDQASPEFGPSPSAIAVGSAGDSVRVVVISNGVAGGLYVYSVSSGPSVQFESHLRRGTPGLTWADSYAREDGSVGEPGVTDLLFIDDQGQQTLVAVCVCV
ncbi:hypothetical protein BaRGS_00008990 [Batillaria attramentaria]|uniref:Choice-of-anchor I domain-containing protein n=1 Tax=Batillaria attramentaria TaxID=370345 RepID=A0ABD0LJG0_9CAEN